MKKVAVRPEHVCITVPLEKITQEENSRAVTKGGETAELMRSMRQSGLLQPIGVRKLDRDNYEVVFGNRRFEAAKKLGWRHIDAMVVEAKEEEQLLLLNAVENMQRVDVSPTEQGRIFSILIKGGLSVSQIAARIGVDRRKVADAVDLFNQVPKEFQDKIAKVKGPRPPKGTIAMGAALGIVRATHKLKLSPKQRNELFKYAATRHMDHSASRAIVRTLKDGGTIHQAIEQANNIKECHVIFGARRDIIRKLEIKYKKSYNNIVLDKLLGIKELGIPRVGMPSPKKALARIARYKAAEGGGEE